MLNQLPWLFNSYDNVFVTTESLKKWMKNGSVNMRIPRKLPQSALFTTNLIQNVSSFAQTLYVLLCTSGHFPCYL